MAFSGISYIAVLVAAICAFVFGAAWYGILGKQWMAALGITEQPKPDPVLYIITFVCQLVMAWVLAGVVGHLGEVTMARGLISAVFVWLGFVLTTMMVNHRFQSARWSLTLIDAGHWLCVLLVMGLVIGLFGA
ncbi:MAG: DUF1761 domain-containing protein [Alphaproteobacteria bacterium]|nr:DUF1761 domain-containing protein [Alphaproteobacteria bacterium]